jgi:hypothetical protein
MPQYSKPLTLNRGVDNQLQFQFLNQEQKPVDVTGANITFRALDITGTQVLLQTYLVPLFPANGIMVLQTTPAELAGISAQKGYYTLEIPVGSFNYPVYVDQNQGGRGDLYIVDSILPRFVPSAEVSIPTGQPFPNLTYDFNANDQPYSTSNNTSYYTSVISTNNNPVLTIQTQLNQYTGNIIIQGSTQVDTDWYPILASANYSNDSSTYGYVVRGFHPFVRVQFNSNAGEVTNVLSR